MKRRGEPCGAAGAAGGAAGAAGGTAGARAPGGRLTVWAAAGFGGGRTAEDADAAVLVQALSQAARRKRQAPGPGYTPGYGGQPRRYFRHVRVAATLSDPHRVHNIEWGGHVHVCTGPRRPWGATWTELRTYA
ncbi:hypothetical protein [Streptomyces sp. NPDC007905]|uniref:hypothetical protein n=1 Tax=Streptomyces sp. NPDC007905 TaxID=3364788 RepID=UPI0036EA4577